MNRDHCAKPIPFEVLLDYWLADPLPADSAALEEHLFACAVCSEELQTVAALSQAVRRLGREGHLHGGLGPTLLERLERDRRVIRRYRAAAGAHIHCGAGADDDLVVLELSADLAGVERVDMLYCAADGTPIRRAERLPVIRGREVVWAEPGDAIRALPSQILRVQLLSVEPSGDRVVGEYTLHHSAFRD